MPATRTGTQTQPTRTSQHAWQQAQDAAAADRARRKYSLGAVHDHVALAAAEIAPRFHIGTVLGWGERTTPDSDHPKGLALDFMCHGNRGTRLADYVLANGKRLGVTYVIYQQRINSLDGKGWDPMEDRGSPTANHMDHVHVSFALRPGDADVVGSGTGAGIRGAGPGPGAGGGGTSSADLADSLQKVAITGLFLVAGVGLVVLGVQRATAPAVKAAQGAVTDAATKAASLAGPEGKAAATAMKATKGSK